MDSNPCAWKNLASELEAYHGCAIAIVLGASDTGKTFFCRYLIQNLSEHKAETKRKIALVDADLGQSTIGPPTTIGLAIFQKPPDTLNNLKPLFMRFVGATSPVGHLLQTLVGVKKMVDKALNLGAQRVIVDTTGLISGNIGLELKFNKIDLINPTHIIAFQRAEELERLLENYGERQALSIHRLTVPRYVKYKTVAQRLLYRQEKFRDYFQSARPLLIPLKAVGLHGTIPSFETATSFKNILVGLCDEQNDTLALGIVEHLDKEGLDILTPLSKYDKIKTIQFGSIRLERTGRQIK